jgi:mitogen-activated protein kinase kinase kinase 4
VERLASVPLNSSTNQPKIHTPDMSCSWHTEFDAMNLPSFKPTFFFLCRIPLDVVHECLRLWLEQQRPGSNPSLLCVRQVTRKLQLA